MMKDIFRQTCSILWKPGKMVFFIPVVLLLSLTCCKKTPLDLNGHISGIITDSKTGDPLESALVKVNLSGVTIDSTRTGIDGSYLIRNLDPVEFEVEASKYAYATGKKNKTVESGIVNSVDIALKGIPAVLISDRYLDFGLEEVSLSFTISNPGKGTFTYLITKSQNWIDVSPSSGMVSDQVVTVNVTVNRSGLSDDFFEESLEVVSTGDQLLQKDSISIFLNGVVDRDGNGYRIVRIGTQTWMAENLNVGDYLSSEFDQKNDRRIEKFCYDDDPENCMIYGGLYQWDEMMDYYPVDSGLVGITQGICPDGWHIPTKYEWITLVEYLGGFSIAGGAMKDTGTIENGTGYWEIPNTGATNASGFSAIPGGNKSYDELFHMLGTHANFWSSTPRPPEVYDPTYTEYPYYLVEIAYNSLIIGFATTAARDAIIDCGNSVRCIKDP